MTAASRTFSKITARSVWLSEMDFPCDAESSDWLGVDDSVFTEDLVDSKFVWFELSVWRKFVLACDPPGEEPLVEPEWFPWEPGDFGKELVAAGPEINQTKHPTATRTRTPKVTSKCDKARPVWEPMREAFLIFTYSNQRILNL